MTHTTRRFLVAAATMVAVAFCSATDAFAREAPPEIGFYSPRPHLTATAPNLDQVTLLVVGAMLGVVVAALVVAGYSFARRHRQPSRMVHAS